MEDSENIAWNTKLGNLDLRREETKHWNISRVGRRREICVSDTEDEGKMAQYSD